MNGRHGIHPYWDLLDPEIDKGNYYPDRGDWCSALKSRLNDNWELEIIGQDNDILAMYLSLHDMELHGSILTISIEK